MIDPSKVSVHLHLFYKDPSVYLIDKVSERYNGKVYISLNRDAKHNEEITSHARGKFEEVQTILVKNRGNDQYGFFKSFAHNNDETDWILYLHDKTIKRIDWLDQITDPILKMSDKEFKQIIDDEKIGIISSGDPRYKHSIITEQDLTELSKSNNFDSRLKIIQARHTLTWYRELQYILLTESGFIETDNLNPDFTAGNMFMARRPIVKMCHKCIHESYFENYYREDGNVEHAMERFYFYVSLCLKYKNVFLGEESND